MSVSRYSATYSSDERNRGMGRTNTIWFYLTDSETADADALAFAQMFESTGSGALINGKLTSLSKQLNSYSKDSLPEGFSGGLAKQVKITFKNPDTGQLEQIGYVFGNAAKGSDEVETAVAAAVTTADLQNRWGNDIGSIIKVDVVALSPS